MVNVQRLPYRRLRFSKETRRNLKAGLLFISPWLLGFIMFTLYPVIASFYYSFTSYDVLTPPKWVGFSNYAQLFTKDNLFWKSLYNTFYYTIFSVPLSMVFGIALAALLNMKVKGMAVYRTIYYLPTIVPVVASSVLWMWMLDPQIGIINGILQSLGIPGPGWLIDPKWSKPALIMMSLWGVGGSMLIYLAGMQDVPQELYESVEIDGGVWWHKFRYITLPMISPVIFFNLIMGMIGAFQYFTQAYVMTQGGPMDSTLFYSLYLFNNAFRYMHMGYASALAWILFVIILIATLIVFNSSARWVYYGGAR
ncbi:carbohydrate ABC transporter membrane protein 1, CUT1 family (TC 3.A.1.1.-) [Caldanaerobius fijiensis DSM 17918]|uniref:Carbohydrate ABC transporter membrane protein 1, CUT1 family (TC 3.A.1.1.-) n=1 Tax=Caldanaerobius fijiensis DSM 17918 TaxID=1121256 RepID=A0A1M4SYH2_9THEO|nr:carbohydrate ABC transporter membrane protein 1, CUT1 family (TC 3.A.1.1.-) [Caldanaerobius fijiensis DSM 17918]